MVETIRKGYWVTNDATVATLLDHYIASVNEYGIGCTENTCGNPLLMQFVIDHAAASGIPDQAIREFSIVLENATRDTIENTVVEANSFIQKNEARSANRPVPRPELLAAPTLESAELRRFLAANSDDNEVANKRSSARSSSATMHAELLWVALTLVLIGGMLYWRKRHSS